MSAVSVHPALDKARSIGDALPWPARRGLEREFRAWLRGAGGPAVNEQRQQQRHTDIRTTTLERRRGQCP